MEFECQECGAQFNVQHEEINEPEYCPFCSEKIVYEEDEEEPDWDE